MMSVPTVWMAGIMSERKLEREHCDFVPYAVKFHDHRRKRFFVDDTGYEPNHDDEQRQG